MPAPLASKSTLYIGDDSNLHTFPSASDLLACRWTDPPCQLVFRTPAELYEHLKDVHVGRKSTNNLCLECFWDGCGSKAKKRDHMTSHVKVHVPLKDHICLVRVAFSPSLSFFFFGIFAWLNATNSFCRLLDL